MGALRGRGVGLVLTLGLIVVAVGIRLTAWEFFRGFPFLTLFPAIIIATSMFGQTAGYLVLVVGGLASWYFFVPEFYSFQPNTLGDTIGIIVFAAVGAFNVWVISALASTLERERAAQAGLQAALAAKDSLVRERELLLEEVHHRVGNNLQQIMGLLQLQLRYVEDEPARTAIREATRRVGLFAEVHRALTLTTSAELEVEPFLSRVVSQLLAAQRPSGIDCRIDIVPGLQWHRDRIVSLALIVQELVANALEHGFGNDDDGTLEVTLRRREDNSIVLQVTDDGSGLAIDPDERKTGMGLRMVEAFATHLRGRFALRARADGRGTVAEVVFGPSEPDAAGVAERSAA